MSRSTETVGSRSQRRAEALARGAEPPPRPVAMVIGTLVGALAALVFAMWEGGLVARAGLPMPQGELFSLSMGAYALSGALAGMMVGAARRVGGAWALGWVLVFGAWLLSGKLGLAIAGSGGGAWAGPALLVPGALAVGVVGGSTDISEHAKLGMATFLFVALALGLPANLHLLGSPASRLALVVDIGIVLLALLATGVAVAAMGLAGRATPAVPLALAAVAGGAAMIPVMMRPEPTWPLATKDDAAPVVLIVVDTLRADHLGVYGYDRPTSPNLDARARSGLVYTDATAPAPWTLPSVASILTGQVSARHGAGVNTGLGSLLSPLRPSARTLPELLSAAGYATAGVTTNPFLTASFGFHQGFQRYDDAPEPAAMPAAIHALFALGVDVWPLYRDSTAITDQALAFVAAQEHPGWFLMVHYMDVHGPHHPDPEDVAALGSSGRGTLVDEYDASIHEVDREVERLLAAVPKGAWVVLTSDHGEQLREMRVHTGAGVPAGTRHGHTLYQEQLHVPLIVWGPRITGRRVERPVTLLDVAPTLLRGSGIEVPERVNGGLLIEAVGGKPPDRPILADSVRWGVEQQAVREGRFKLIRWHGQGRLLFDLDEEPEEIDEVQVQADQEVQAVVRHLEGLLPPVGLASVEAASPLGAELTGLLERLGYLDDGGGGPEAAPASAP